MLRLPCLTPLLTYLNLKKIFPDSSINAGKVNYVNASKTPPHNLKRKASFILTASYIRMIDKRQVP
jgi:hypothetical protein